MKENYLINNGARVCDFFIKTFPPINKSDESSTSYISIIENQETTIVLSGLYRRIDDYAKKRLGKEIEDI